MIPFNKPYVSGNELNNIISQQNKHRCDAIKKRILEYYIFFNMTGLNKKI